MSEQGRWVLDPLAKYLYGTATFSIRPPMINRAPPI
ncbi:protein of unknown function [Nitratireductor aquimarinus]